MARLYYATLLSSRKDRACDLVNDHKRQLGRDLTSEETCHVLQKECSDRELKMVLKAVEKGCDANWWTDELLVTTALQIAVATGQRTSVLTRDRDVLEQFEKLCGLLNADYQAYHFGRHFDTNRDRFECISMPADEISEAYFITSESQLVRKPVPPNDFVEWVLPYDFQPVTVSCVLFGGPPENMGVQVVSYHAEQEMRDLFRTKGKTLGCNVELPGDLNCHATGFPSSIPTPRNCVIVGKDRWRETPPGTVMRWSMLDYSHAILDDGPYTQRPSWLDSD